MNKNVSIAAAVALVVGFGIGRYTAPIAPPGMETAGMPTGHPAAAEGGREGMPSGHPPMGGGAQAPVAHVDCAAEREGLEKRLVANAADAEAAIHLGACDVDAGETARGLERLRTGVGGTTDAHLLLEAGQALRRAGDAAGAIASFEKGLAGAPNDADLLYHAGLTAFHDLGDETRAVEHWTAYLRVAPDAPNAEMIGRAVENLRGGGSAAH